jgi:MscS family membrane protein
MRDLASSIALPEWISLRVEGWIVDVFVIVLLTLVAVYLARLLFDRLERRFAQTANLWDDALLEAVRRPLRWLMLLIGLSWAAEVAREQATTSLLDALDPIRDLGVIVLVSWFLIRVISAVEVRLQNQRYVRKPMDQTTARAVGRLLRGATIITAVLVAMQALGYSVSSVLAFGGIGGLAIGFAAKDLLANLFGGLIIYLDRPFRVGDWVRSPDREIEGVVEDIGWRVTTIRTFDKRPLYVPNATFTTMSVQNPSRMTHRRIYETIGVRYADAGKVGDIVRDVRAMLETHEAIDQSQTLIVNFNRFGPSSLDFFIYCMTRTTNWIEYHANKEDVLLKVLGIIDGHGAEVAFPTQTLHIEGHGRPGPESAPE